MTIKSLIGPAMMVLDTAARKISDELAKKKAEDAKAVRATGAERLLPEPKPNTRFHKSKPFAICAPDHPQIKPRAPHTHQNTVDKNAEAAAARMEALGASPRIQLEAAKLSSGQRNLTYKPHQGAKEVARRAARSTS